MNKIKDWSALLCITAIICTLIEFLIPPGKIEKTLNMVLGTFMVCAFIMPISTLKNNLNSSFEGIFSNTPTLSQKATQENLNNQVFEETKKNVETVIMRYLKNRQIIPEKVEVLMDINKDNCIVMIRCKIYISKNYENLKDSIISSVEKDLNIKTEVIVN